MGGLKRYAGRRVGILGMGASGLASARALAAAGKQRACAGKARAAKPKYRDLLSGKRGEGNHAARRWR